MAAPSRHLRYKVTVVGVMFMADVLIVELVKHRRPTLLDVERFTLIYKNTVYQETVSFLFFYLCEGPVGFCSVSGMVMCALFF